jgi:hypothetical protein
MSSSSSVGISSISGIVAVTGTWLGWGMVAANWSGMLGAFCADFRILP